MIEYQRLSKNDLIQIRGGFSLSGALLNGISRLFKTLYDLGYSLGGAIRRIHTNQFCLN